MIELKHIDKYYNIGTVNEVCLFKDFNLTVDDGDFISVIGSNGSGKTSMLNLIMRKLRSGSRKYYFKWRRYFSSKRVYQTEKDRTCLSKSSNGNLPIYDNP